jgi:hypothetical protein
LVGLTQTESLVNPSGPLKQDYQNQTIQLAKQPPTLPALPIFTRNDKRDKMLARQIAEQQKYSCYIETAGILRVTQISDLMECRCTIAPYCQQR